MTDDYGYKVQRGIIEGKGVLYTNLEKIDEYSPDLKGKLLYKGELLKLGGWVTETSKGMIISIGIQKRKPRDSNSSE